MKAAHSQTSRSRGYALLLVLLFMGVSSLMLAGVMDWISTRARLTQRNQGYQSAVAAAESAAAKAVGAMTVDYMQNDESTVAGRINTYARMVPDKTEAPAWANVSFFDTEGRKNLLTVTRLGARQYGDLQTRYQGLRGYFTPYQVTAGASLEAMPGVSVAASAQYDLQLAEIPVFGMQSYSAMDLEICPGASMVFNGRVHANGSLYICPSQSTVIFRNHVTAAGDVLTSKHPEDPVDRQGGLISFQKSYDSATKSLKLPIGTLHSPAVLRALIERPPVNEKASSLLGQQRFYNLAELVVTVDDAGINATSGSFNNFKTKLPDATISAFLTTNQVFYDKRESRNVQTVEMDINKFIAQMNSLKGKLGREVKTVYLANLLPTAPDTINGVRLINGATLPATGLTVATLNPLYIKGHYNVFSSHIGSTNTTKAMPAALAADAVTVLSGSWDDKNSQKGLNKRVATATTVNAGIITGIVPTGGGFYSGGYENALRLLEDWTNLTLNFNGSLAIFFQSQIAASPWGALDDVYIPPRRTFTWDGNYQTDTKLPPSTPLLRTVIIGHYAVLSAP